MTLEQQNIIKSKFPWVSLDNPDFSNALNRILNSDDNIIVCASGGTGKSVLLKLAATLLEGNTVVLSTTGVSAANLAGEGIATTTVHSFFRLPPVTIVENPTIYADIAPVIQNIDTILIDEVSMLNASVMDTVLKLTKRYRSFCSVRMPRVILFGDVLQLPPVIEDKDKTIMDLFKRKYNGNTMFYHAEEYKKLNVKVLHLSHIYRQDDMNWKEVLSRIRLGQHTKYDIDCINSRVVNEREFINSHSELMYLAATNKRVQALNEFYLDTDNSTTYRATIEGIYDIKGTNHKMSIEIAPGMQVMCTHNNKYEGYQNGMLGRITKVAHDSVYIKTKENKEYAIGYETWDQYKYIYNKLNDSVENIITGSFSQIGCVPAFAATIHKSQGLTLDSLMIDPCGLSYMADGLAYVALSRCTSLQGIGLSREIHMNDIKTSIEGLRFLEENI